MRSARRSGCLSFHPRKIVTTGEGGAVTTDEAALDAAVRSCVTTAGRRSATCPCPDSTTGCRTSSARSASRSCARSRSSSRRASGSPAGTRSARAPVLTPSAMEGDRHGWQAYVVSSTAATRRSARSGKRHRGPDRDLGAPHWSLSCAGRVPRRRPRVRARARAPVRGDDPRGGGGASREGLDVVASEC